MSHKRLSPSGASRWLKCSGSLADPIPPDEPSEYAKEGSAAHRWAEMAYMGIPLELGMIDSEGFEVTQEVLNAVEIYLQAIAAEVEMHRTFQREAGSPDATVSTSLEVQLADTSVDDFGGTIDCLITSPGFVSLVDFKYGAGVPVEVEQNEQLGCYALLSTPPGSMLRFVVVQPRSFHHAGPVRAWEPTWNWLEGLLQRIVAQRNAYLTGNVEYHTGDHCRWCPKRVTCDQRAKEGQQFIELSLQGTAGFSAIPAEHLAAFLSKRDCVVSWFKSLEEHAIERAKQGEQFPGLQLVNRYSNRRWNLSDDALVRQLKKVGYGKKDVSKVTMFSPAEVEKLPNVTKALVDGWTVREVIGFALKPVAEGGEPATISTPAEVFAGVDVAGAANPSATA